MKAAFTTLLAATLGNGVLAAGLGTKLVDVGVRLMSWNIRLATTNPGAGEELWSVRRHKVAAELNFETTGRAEALLCFQEVLHEQLLDLESDLGDEWVRVGVGRDDGVNAGEFSPIFYRKSTWELEQNKTYWLSETPDVPSKGCECTPQLYLFHALIVVNRGRCIKPDRDCDATPAQTHRRTVRLHVHSL